MDARQKSMSLAHELILRRIGTAMATGGTVMAPGDKLEHSMDKLGIKGQSLMTSRSQDGELSPSVSRPSSSTASGDTGDAIGSFSMPPEAVGVLETVINMNKALEQQIDALRIRLTVEAKNHDTERTKILKEKDKELKKKDSEAGDLRDSLIRREDRIDALAKDSREKDIHIQQKEREIDDLKDLVKTTETYAEQLQKRVGKLKGDKHKLESDTVYKEQSDEIRKLRHEIVSMKEKVNFMEKELGRAKHAIDGQNVKIKGLESEKGALGDKFREELERAGRAMRSEVERMREVMKQQYMEMRNLREQNIEISSDVRDIKDILLKGTLNPDPNITLSKTTEKIDVNNFKSPRPIQKSPNFGMRVPMTSRPAQTTKPSTNRLRASVPSSPNPLYKTTQSTSSQGSTQSSFPSITKSTEPIGKWIPAGSRNATLKSARGKRK